MREPVRLGETSESELESALLNLGASYRGSAHARRQTLAALGVGAGAMATAVGTGAVAASTQAPSLAMTATTAVAKVAWLKVVAAVAVVGTAVVPVGYYVNAHRAPGVEIKAPAVVATTVAPRLGPPVREVPPSAVVPARVSDSKAGRTARADGRRATSRPTTLAQELVALDAVRGDLAAGNSSGALSLLDTYQRAYPHGDMALEAEVLRIEAFARAGRSRVARQRAETFLRLHPHSVLAARARVFAHD